MSNIATNMTGIHFIMPFNGSILQTSYRCLINGMLIQLAAATAAKGTNLPISGEIC